MTADLAALVGSRIAHDLASPLGAIANGIELLGLTGAPDSPELALISESVDAATARIKAFRIAFGAAPPGQQVTEADLRALFTGFAQGRKLEIDWPPSGDLPRDLAKLICLALMCLETALPWGGRIAVRRDSAAWHLTARGNRLRIDPEVWAGLGADSAPATVQPAEVQFALIRPAAAAADRQIAVSQGESSLEIRV